LDISLYYYSGAGNTKFIAKKIRKGLNKHGHQVHFVKITDQTVTEVKRGDAYIVGFPIYDLTSPQLVKDLITNLHDQHKPISFFCTKAFASADAMKELYELSTRQHLSTISTMEVYMPGTDALVLFAAPNSVTEKVLKFFHSRNIDKKVDRFIMKVSQNKPQRVIRQKWYTYLSFLIPQKTKEAFHAQYTQYIPEFYSQTDLCIECMKCVNECPRDNIRFDDYIQFDLNCDMCLHCVHHCPVESIQIGDFTQGHVRYRKVDIA